MEQLTTEHPLTVLFYLLLRDELPAGQLDRVVTAVESHPGPWTLSNGYLAAYAGELRERIEHKCVKKL